MCAPQDDSTASDEKPSKDDRDELVESLLSDAREELGRADGKASILLSAVGIVVSVLLAGAIARDWNPTRLTTFEWLWWIGTMTGAFAILALGAAVWLRIEHRASRDKLTYFGHVANFENIEALIAGLDWRASAASPQDRAIDQLFTVSKIVGKKYRRIRLGMGLFGAASLLSTAAVIFDRLSG